MCVYVFFIVYFCKVLFYNVGMKCLYILLNIFILVMFRGELNFIYNLFVKEEFVKKIVGDDEGNILL